jgi:DHA3 family macrolide efflux protein-like MFS transporter
MVPQEQLTRVQGLNQMLNGGLNIAAAPLAALLLTILPIQGVLLVDIVTAALAITTLLLVVVPQPARIVSAGAPQSTFRAYWDDLRAGWRYLVNWRGLLLITGVAMMINLVLSPATALIPLLVTKHFHGTAWHLSALEAGFGIGVLAGGLLLGVWGGFKNRIMTSLLGVAGIGVGILLMGLAPVSLFALAVFGMVLGGVMSSLANGPLAAIFQANVAPAMQGRLFALLGSGSAAMMPLGLAIAGPMAEVIGVRAWFVFGGSITVLIAFVCLFVPAVRNIEQERDDHPDPEEAPAGQQAATTM